MDQNKIDKLKAIGYVVNPSCGTCKNFTQKSDYDFGECEIHEYVHLKHSGGKRKLSVVQYGLCNSYEPGEVDFLHGFKEFLTDTRQG